MTKRALFLAAACLALAAAAHGARPGKGRADALPLKEFMGHVMQRNAEQLWAWSAERVDAHGVHDGKPTGTAGWESAESDALTIVELTHALETPAYRLPSPAWPRYVRRARSAAAASAKAAEAQDYAALQIAADDLNAACVACHLRFAPDLEKAPPLPKL